MAKPFHEWTVLPHGKLTHVDENILTVTGLLRMPPMGDVERRMTVVRLNDGNAVIYSAIALDEPQMAALEAFATPRYLVVPSDIHRMDVVAWKHRYPTLTVLAPAHARKKVEELVPVDATSMKFPDPAVELVTVSGTGERELALLVTNAGATTLILNDIIFGLPTRPGVRGWFFEKIGMTGDQPHVPPLVKMRQVKNPAALAAQLERWAQLPDLKRVIISHGDIIASEPALVLDRIAKELAA
ncbi:MAG TPA: hypothetical protein VHC69_33585 [Polyangiaceae bacterium]|nr:hypothetical protein [Polyangiaceae bacterium]